MPREVEGVVTNLKQIASDVLAREAAAAEERIRLFTEQQTIALDALRERALKEHRALVKLVCPTERVFRATCKLSVLLSENW